MPSFLETRATFLLCCGFSRLLGAALAALKGLRIDPLHQAPGVKIRELISS